ncbi:ABC transporter ATP-binding protein [Bacillus spongiae]|uniref:ABC transporter ATP-binding protein n=2 Tax=Bacillus spongiae TaxID=2683610 RepID=A0ABU8HFJ2_9BACI
MELIVAEQLAKRYGEHEVVSGISLMIREGEVLGVIGPNGAGKSTMLEMIVGLRKPDVGSIRYWTESFHSSIGVQLQSTPFFPGLTAFENLQLFSSFYKKPQSIQEYEDLLQSCRLLNVRNTEASSLSGGQQKRLSIAAALTHDPTIIFLDEPTAALDPTSRKEIHDIIRNLHEKKKTIVFTSHDMDEVEKLATRIVIIQKGVILAEGAPKELYKRFNVDHLEKLYLKLMEEEKR